MKKEIEKLIGKPDKSFFGSPGILVWLFYGGGIPELDNKLKEEVIPKTLKLYTFLHKKGIYLQPESADTFRNRYRNIQVVIPYDRIINIRYKDKTGIETETKNKSVLGRALIGGILLGPLGAAVGGMTGVGQKDVTKSDFLLIHYKKEDGEDGVIGLCGTRSEKTKIAIEKFINRYRKLSTASK